MYKIVILVIKYVKLAVLNEMLVKVRSDYMKFSQVICKEMTNETRAYYEGQVFVTSMYARSLEAAIRNIKESPVREIQKPGVS